MMFDYITLKIIWWLIFGVIVVAFFVTAGMDIGVNFLLPIVGKSDYDRRLIINSTGPTWEGNQVWLILFVAGLLAIWPTLYATLLYSMYFLCLILVFTLILRPPGIDYRNKINSHTWRITWDICLFIGAIAVALAIAILVAYLFTGLPYYFDNDMRPIYQGSFYKLISPLSLLCFIVVLSWLSLHGALFLQYKLQDIPAQRSKKVVQIAGWTFLAAFIVTGVYVGFWIPAYKIDFIPELNSEFLPTAKIVSLLETGWCYNFTQNYWLWILPVLVLLATRVAMRLSKFGKPVTALFVNAIGMLALVFTVAAAIFPFLLLSQVNLNHSLTIWDAAASKNTLWYSLLAVVVLLPIVLLYTTWVYRVMRGKVKIYRDSY
jgi:cytochrome bd ubiquinol oxidase subunit II